MGRRGGRTGQLHSLVISKFPLLGGSASGRHDCRATITKAILPHVYKILFQLYINNNMIREEQFEEKLRLLKDITPNDLNLKSTFWLTKRKNQQKYKNVRKESFFDDEEGNEKCRPNTRKKKTEKNGESNNLFKEKDDRRQEAIKKNTPNIFDLHKNERKNKKEKKGRGKVVGKEIKKEKEKETDTENGSNELGGYTQAIEMFRKFSDYSTPYAKLDCLIFVRHSINHAVAAFWEKAKSSDQVDEIKTLDLVITADDLVALFALLIVKSGVAHLLSAVDFINEFLDDCYTTGDGAYCLTTLQVAIGLLEKMADSAEFKKRRKKDTGYTLDMAWLTLSGDKTG